MKPKAEADAGPNGVVLIGLATWGVIQVVAAVLSTHSTGTTVLQALAAEVGAGRAGVAWSRAEKPTRPRRVLIGVGFGVAFAALLVGAGAISGAVSASRSSGSIVTLLLGAVLSTAVAMKEELVLRGIVLRAFEGRVPAAALLGIAALVAAAAAAPGAGPVEIVFRAALGAALLSVWRIDGGAFMAVAAHAALLFVLGPVLSGGLADVRVSAGVFAGARGIVSSPAAAVAMTGCAIGLAFVARPGPRLFR